MTSIGVGYENDVIMPEALRNPTMIGNISKPESIHCMPACKVQENGVQMSFATYPQRANFFYQKTFCDVASHIWQRTCQNENRAYFIQKDQPLLCPILKSFDEFFGYSSAVEKKDLVIKPI